MKTKSISFILLLVASFSSFLMAQKTTISGVEIPKTYAFNNASLTLNGSAVREKFFMDIYVGSLYLPAKSSNANQIINANSDMGFRLKIVSSLLSSSKMQAGIKESFGKVSQQYPVSATSLIKFITLFSEKINKGDDFFIGYTAAEGLSVSKNGKNIGSIKDLALKKALFATWLRNAISKNFTEEVLSGN